MSWVVCILQIPQKLRRVFVFGLESPAVNHWKGNSDAQRKSHLTSASSHITLIFILHPSFFCDDVAIHSSGSLGRLLDSQTAGVSYCLAGDWASGGDADGSILMSPCLLGTDAGQQVERDLLTHRIYTVYTYTKKIQWVCSHACVSAFTHICFHLHSWFLLDTPIQKHLDRAAVE